MSVRCDKCPENDLCNCPTIITAADIDAFVQHLEKFEVKSRPCIECSNEFYPNYDICMCDECYFAQFPKEEVEKFMRRFFE